MAITPRQRYRAEKQYLEEQHENRVRYILDKHHKEIASLTEKQAESLRMIEARLGKLEAQVAELYNNSERKSNVA